MTNNAWNLGLSLCVLASLPFGLSMTAPVCAQPPVGNSSISGTPVTVPTPTPSPKSGQSSTSMSSMAAVAQDAPYRPQVTIWVNDTDKPEDDLVRYDDGNTVPEDATTHCEIFVANPNGQDVTVVLNHPDNRIAFGGEDADQHLTLTLDGNGAHNGFSITGKIKSTDTTKASMNVHWNNVNTSPLLGSATVTVYSFAPSILAVTGTGTYALTKQTGPKGGSQFFYGCSGTAVDMIGSVNVLPSGVDTSDPRLSHWRFAMVQNVQNVAFSFTSSNPYLVVNNTGGDVMVPTTRSNSVSLLSKFNDGSTPLYKPDLALYADSTATPLNGAFETHDTPSWGVESTRQVYDNNGNLLFTYSYNDSVAKLKGKFTDYVVLFDPNRADANYQLSTIRQTGWTMNLTSNTGNQYITPNTTDAPYDKLGVKLTGPTANSVVALYDPNNADESTTKVTLH